MRFVALKTVEQQQVLALHRLRQGVVKMRTALVNQMRGLLAEFGVVAPVGRDALRALLAILVGDERNPLPTLLRNELAHQRARLDQLDKELGSPTAVAVMRSVRADTHQGPRRIPSHHMAGYMDAISFLPSRTQTLANGTGPYRLLSLAR